MTSLAKILNLFDQDEHIVITDYEDNTLENFEVFDGPVFGVFDCVIDHYGFSPVKRISTDNENRIEIEIFFVDRTSDEREENEDEVE